MNLWLRLPVVVRAVFGGLLIGSVITLPWAYLARATVRQWPTLPWPVAVAWLLLWIWWRYVNGDGPPRSNAARRRENARTNSVSDVLWGPALLAGILGIATSLFILNLINRLVVLPADSPSDLSLVPTATLLMLHVTGSVVAGVVEEVSFRGYMQVPIEHRYGPFVAIPISATVFGLAHFTHPGTLPMMPFYLAVGVTYGSMAYLTNSVVPGMLLHTVGDLLDGLPAVLHHDAAAAVTASQPVPPPTGSIVMLVFGVAITAAMTIAAFSALGSGREPQTTRPPASV